MFSGAANPYDELVNKATDENLASEDWDVNLQICDKVTAEGTNGARNAVAALTKRLAHRNPNVQLYALELANTLVQNCGKPMHEELSSRIWTDALRRLVEDRGTDSTVQKKALKYISDWTQEFENSGESNLGLMSELYDSLRKKNMTFEEQAPAPEQNEETRRRAEEEELARVIELSKREQGGWGRSAAPNNNAGGSSSQPARQQPQPQSQPAYAQQPVYAQPAQPQADHDPAPLDINTATRVRALYAFKSQETGELNFERGDIIKVLHRGFDEWWRGSVHGKIGIFPVVYVEALPEQTPQELLEEAQDESRVFASLGLVEQLLAALKAVDPEHGDRLEDNAEIQRMYQQSVALQPDIQALLKKYNDQKAELEHISANFTRAIHQYEEFRGAGAPPAGGPPYYQQNPDPYSQQAQAQAPYGQQAYVQQPEHYPQPQPAAYPQQPQPQQSAQYPQPYPYQTAPQPGQAAAQPAHALAHSESQPQPQHQHGTEPGQYYQHQTASQASLDGQTTGAPSFPPSSPPRQSTHPGSAGVGAGADPTAEHAAAWDAYYRSRGELPPQQQGGVPLVESPNAMPQAQPQFPQQYADGVTAGMNRMTVG